MSPSVSRASMVPSEAAMSSFHTADPPIKLLIRIPPLKLRTPLMPPPPEPSPRYEEPEPPTPESTPARRRSDINSKTFNQPWTIEEQHCLEKLLIDIPKGERNRWSRISQGMGGRRSARQVASRVQKYFEKLDKAGIEHPG